MCMHPILARAHVRNANLSSGVLSREPQPQPQGGVGGNLLQHVHNHSHNHRGGGGEPFAYLLQPIRGEGEGEINPFPGYFDLFPATCTFSRPGILEIRLDLFPAGWTFSQLCHVRFLYYFLVSAVFLVFHLDLCCCVS